MNKSTNRDFAKNDEVFRKACELANVEPTKRQASKWRRRCGRAWQQRGEALELLAKETPS